MGARALVAMLLLGLGYQEAQTQTLRLETITTELDSPVFASHAGDARLFVVERRGTILVVQDGALSPTPFLDIRDRVLAGGERGLLSVAFHPEFAGNGEAGGRFFVDYTRSNDGATVISRFRVGADPDRADAGSEEVLLVIEQPFSNHNGGQLQFGPEGFLYIGLGDGGSGNDPLCTAQRTDTLLGKLLRLDVDRGSAASPYYAIPLDNPFVGSGTFPDEAWAVGLRNPWRFSFDRQTGDLYIADVGQNAREEVNFEPASAAGGANYGWKVLEGTLCLGSTSGCPGPVGGCSASGYVPPVLEYTHSGNNCSITGGYVYRGEEIPELRGAYLYGDFCSGRLWAARRQGGGWRADELDVGLGSLSSFAEDVEGELYVMSVDGELQRLRSQKTDPGELRMVSDAVAADEAGGVVSVAVERIGGTDGAVAAEVVSLENDAEQGTDYQPVAATVAWADGEDGERAVQLVVLDDALPESDETLRLRLRQPTGGAGVGEPRVTVVTIRDDDGIAVACAPGPTVLCLQENRFEVHAEWQTSSDQGSARTLAITPDTGAFWFFAAGNLELVVKVLDGCAVNGHFWVFATGLTDVGVELRVRDAESGQQRSWQSPQGRAFLPILDTAAFASCS